MPPLAMSLTSLYLPSGVVIRFERTLKATLPTMRFCRSVAAYRACGAEPLFGGRLLAGGQRNGGVDLVARGDRSGGEKAAVLDDQLPILADDAVAPPVALGREPPDGAEQRRDHQPENGTLQTAARLASFFGH